MVSTSFGPRGASIRVDDQQLSRLTDGEVREVVLQCIVFGGKQLREDVRKWLSDSGFEQMAEIVSSPKTEESNRG